MNCFYVCGDREKKANFHNMNLKNCWSSFTIIVTLTGWKVTSFLNKEKWTECLFYWNSKGSHKLLLEINSFTEGK